MQSKKFIWIFMFLIFISYAYAEQVIIFNLNYDNGKITLKEQYVKEGYYPDRNLEQQKGYRCNLVDPNRNDLYSMNFDLPNKVYTDSTQNNQVSGGVIILNETDFSFIMPYLSGSNSLVCYNPRGYEVLNEKVLHPIMSPSEKNLTWVYVSLIILLIMILAFLIQRKLNK